MTERQKLTLTQKIAQLKEFLRALKKLQGDIDKKKFFSDEIIRRGIERYLQLALEATLDIADTLINEEKLQRPKEYRDTFFILADADIIPQDFARRLAPAAGFRNILVHDYVKLDAQKVFEHFKKDTKDLEKFLKLVQAYIGK